MQKLTVKKGKKEEVNKDIIRVHESKRVTENGKNIKNGLVCGVFVKETGKNTYAILRGHLDYPGWNENDIAIDETLREKLGIKLNDEPQFLFEKAGLFGWIKWAWGASDPAYQISIRIAVVLGVVSVLLALLSILISIR